MPPIEGDLETSSEVPKGCPGLGGFSCGNGSLPAAEEDVEGIIEDLHAGEWPDLVFRVTRERPSGAVVGVVAIELRKGPLVDHPAVPEEENSDAAYIVVVALSEVYRGRLTDKHGVSLSDVLLRDALEYVAAGEDEVPPIQAAIAPANLPSKELFERFNFFDSNATVGALLYIRPRGLPIELPAVRG
jgi:hypothetical protein